MRKPIFVLAILFAAEGLLGAQNPPAGNAPPAANAAARLDGYLLRWEQEMRKVQTLAATLTREDKDKAFGTKSKFTGNAQFMKSGQGPTSLNLAALELKPEGKADFSDKFICTGTYLYQFLPAQKEIHAHEMPKPKPGQVADDSFLGFLFGMKAESAKRRYALTLAKEDQHYVYVHILPRFPDDKAEFNQARLVLRKDNFLPRQLWFEHVNGNEVLWDIPTLQAGVQLERRIFDAPRVPPGWKFVPVAKKGAAMPATQPPPTQPPPRVARPKN